MSASSPTLMLFSLSLSEKTQVISEGEDFEPVITLIFSLLLFWGCPFALFVIYLHRVNILSEGSSFLWSPKSDNFNSLFYQLS